VGRVNYRETGPFVFEFSGLPLDSRLINGKAKPGEGENSGLISRRGR